MEPDEFFGTHYDDIAYVEGRMPVGFGAQAWLLMHYAYVQNAEVLRKLGVYGARINAGVSPAAALAALRSGGEVEMAGALAEYAKQPAFKSATIRPTPLSDSQLHVRKLDDVAAARVLTELAFHISVLGKRRAMFSRLTRGLPDDPWLLADAAQLAMESSGSKKAKVERLASYEQRIAALGQPYDAEIPAGLAEAHLTLGAPNAWDYEPRVEDAAEVRLARAAFDRGSKLDPDHLESLVGYALTCRLLGDCLEEAAARLRHAIEIAPLSWGVVSEQAELLQALGKQDEADGYRYVLTRIAPQSEFRRYALHHTRVYAQKVLVVP
jgi:tetratricopeptide (TPR) repeat protein